MDNKVTSGCPSMSWNEGNVKKTRRWDNTESVAGGERRGTEATALYHRKKRQKNHKRNYSLSLVGRDPSNEPCLNLYIF